MGDVLDIFTGARLRWCSAVDCEAIAESITVAFDAPRGAMLIATALDLSMRPEPRRGATLVRHEIRCDMGASIDKREMLIACCIAQWTMRERRLVVCSATIEHIARALLMPRVHFTNDARTMTRSQLQVRYSRVPREIIAARIRDLCSDSTARARSRSSLVTR